MSHFDDSQKAEATHLESKFPLDEDGYTKGGLTGDDVITQEAIEAEAKEHAESMWASVKRNPKAVFWSVAMSMTIVMEAYDNTIIGSSFAVSAFNKQFGHRVGNTAAYSLAAGWQSALTQGKSFTGFLGLLFAGWLCDKVGFKWTVQVGLLINLAGVFPIFFGKKVWVLLIGELICGFPWGMFVTLAASYASEVGPMALRPFLTAWIQICFAIGQMIGAGVLYQTQARTDQWAYRIPFAVQWAWLAVLIPVLALAPESPWWLLRNGRHDDAARTLSRLTGRSTTDPEVLNTLALIQRTDELEKSKGSGTSYLDCFRGIDRRRTLIAMFIFGAEPLIGLVLGNNATYFFLQAGLSSKNSFAMGLGYQGLAFCGVIISWFLLHRWGRRSIYLVGITAAAIMMFIIGFLDIAAAKHTGARWAQSTLLIIFNFCCACSVYPLTYLIITEIPSTRLRAKTISLSRDAYFIGQTAAGIASPYMINPTAANMKGKAGFVWGAIAAAVTVSVYFILPECKDRSAREIDILFHRKTAARDFKKTEILPEETE